MLLLSGCSVEKKAESDKEELRAPSSIIANASKTSTADESHDSSVAENTEKTNASNYDLFVNSSSNISSVNSINNSYDKATSKENEVESQPNFSDNYKVSKADENDKMNSDMASAENEDEINASGHGIVLPDDEW